jgi:hypothetical protein
MAIDWKSRRESVVSWRPGRPLLGTILFALIGPVARWTQGPDCQNAVTAFGSLIEPLTAPKRSVKVRMLIPRVRSFASPSLSRI